MSVEKRAARLHGGGLYLVVTAPVVGHLELARIAVAQRVPMLQLREKEMDDGALLELARRIRDITIGSDTLFIVNDRPDISAAVGADGVHVGRSDADPAAARIAVGPERILGVSVNGISRASELSNLDVDYFGTGPIFPTATKPDADNPVGPARITEIAAACPDVPIVAIGGIDASNVATTLRAGASYAAVVSAVCASDHPDAALKELTSAIELGRLATYSGETGYDVDGQDNHDALAFCPRCSAGLIASAVRGARRLTCPQCHYIIYSNPAPVTATIVEQDSGLLLVRRKYDPGRGLWCLPTGFIETGETPEESAVREVREESGLDVELTGIYDSWSTDEDPRTPVVCFAFTARVIGGDLRAGDDASEAAFFSLDAPPRGLAFETHRRVIARYSRWRRDTVGRVP